MRRVYNAIDKMIGKTPMFEFARLKKKLALKANVFGKCEFYNPLFSVKDRVAGNMVEIALRAREIKDDAVLVMAASGDEGVSTAAICAAKGLALLLVMPEDTTKDIIKMIRYLGADVVLTPADDGIKGAIAKAEILAEKSEKVVLLNCFEEEAEIEAHLFGSVPEILDDMGGEIDVLVAAVEKNGLLGRVVQALKSSNPDLYAVVVKSDKNEGLGQDKVDEVMEVGQEDAKDMAKALAQTEGLPIGIVAGKAMVAAVDLAMRDEFKHKNIVVILPDKINE